MTTTDDTFTTPAGEVTDHDPTGVQWVAGSVTADPIPEELLGSCAFEEGQTHRTVAGFYELGADDVEEGVLTHPTKDAAAPGNGVDDYWSVYALVPAQVADGEPRSPGDPWLDLLCALALLAGRTRSTGAEPRGSDLPLSMAGGALVLWADPAQCTGPELAQLAAWGWTPDQREPAFLSWRHGGFL